MASDAIVADGQVRQRGRWLHPAARTTPLTRRMTEIASRPPWWECWYCAAPLVPVGSLDAVPLVEVGADGRIRAIDGYQLPEVDHIVPRSRGGSDDIDNLALSCSSCNGEKRAMSLDEFIARKFPGLLDGLEPAPTCSRCTAVPCRCAMPEPF